MKYKLITKIGSGTYGVVYAACLKDEEALKNVKKPSSPSENETNEDRVNRLIQPYKDAGLKIYAIKKVFNSSDGSIRDTTLIEMSCLDLFGYHPNLVKVHQDIFNNDFIYIVMDYYPKTLRDLFRMDFDERMSLFGKLAYQLCSVLSVIHKMNLCHRDIKPMNILIDDDNNVHLADWGLAKILNGQKDDEEVNTLWYRPPELLTDKMKTYEASPTDMWALGITLLDYINGYYVFEKVYNEKDVKTFCKRYNPISDILGDDKNSVPSAIISFIDKLTKLHPKERITADEALNILVNDFHLNVEEAQPFEYTGLCQGCLPELEMMSLSLFCSFYKNRLRRSTINFIQNIFCNLVNSNQLSSIINSLLKKSKNKNQNDAISTVLSMCGYFACVSMYEADFEELMRFDIPIEKHKIVKDIFLSLNKNILFGFS